MNILLNDSTFWFDHLVNDHGAGALRAYCHRAHLELGIERVASQQYIGLACPCYLDLVPSCIEMPMFLRPTAFEK
jgi:hypothetical protein